MEKVGEMIFKRTSCYNNSENSCSQQLSPELGNAFQPRSTAETYAGFLDRKGEDGWETILGKIQVHFWEKTNDSSHF